MAKATGCSCVDGRDVGWGLECVDDMLCHANAGSDTLDLSTRLAERRVMEAASRHDKRGYKHGSMIQAGPSTPYQHDNACLLPATPPSPASPASVRYQPGAVSKDAIDEESCKDAGDGQKLQSWPTQQHRGGCDDIH